MLVRLAQQGKVLATVSTVTIRNTANIAVLRGKQDIMLNDAIANRDG